MNKFRLLFFNFEKIRRVKHNKIIYISVFSYKAAAIVQAGVKVMLNYWLNELKKNFN